jgi:hypothetical protein
MDERLRFRRQFVIARGAIQELRDWQRFTLNDLHLYAHPDLEVAFHDAESTQIALLGYLFDPEHPTKGNAEILNDILAKATHFSDWIVALKRYPGRYALVFRDASTFAVMNDPLGLREVYYCTAPNRIVCGSQPNLLDTFSQPHLGVTDDPRIAHFHAHELPVVRSGRLWVGDETYFRHVRHLMPNHYLDLRSLGVERYWPNRRLEHLDLDAAVAKSCEYLEGTLKAVASRYDVMMAVTSGIDSRSLLAASRRLADRIYYFINKEGQLTDHSPDVRIPREMFKELKIPFHVHVPEGPVDEEFRKVFLSNTFMSTDLVLPTIYNVYFKRHEKKVNLLGVGEIGRNYYGRTPAKLTGYFLARSLKYRSSEYATDWCEKWLRQTTPVANAYNVDLMQLFLWEGLLANWGVVGNSESDIAIEEFNPYDSHYIYEIMLSIDRRHTEGAVPEFFRAMFQRMWPELLKFPFNAPETKLEWLKDRLKAVGVFQPIKRAWYAIEERRFQSARRSVAVTES